MRIGHPLQIGTIAEIVSNNLYLVEEHKYFQSESIYLIDYSTADAQLRAFRNHRVDVIAGLLVGTIILAQTNSDLKRQHQLPSKVMNQITKMIHSLDLVEIPKILEPSNPKRLQQVKRVGQQLHQQQLLNQFIEPQITWDNGIVNHLQG